MHNAIPLPSPNQPSNLVTTSNNLSSSNPAVSHHIVQNQLSHQMLEHHHHQHHVPSSNNSSTHRYHSSSSSANLNVSCSSCNNSQQPMVNNVEDVNHQPTSPNSNCPASINGHHSSEQFQDGVMPMESEKTNEFIVVKRKKKKVKFDSGPNVTPSSCTSTSSSSTCSTDSNNSTSSTNTSSIDTNVIPADNGRTFEKTSNNVTTSTRCISYEVSQQARRYAETRYPYPPFMMKFNHNVDEKVILQLLKVHFSTNYKFELNIVGHRLKYKQELLLFVGNRESFLMLFDDQKWPSTINTFVYDKSGPNHLPPQFSLVLRNVPAHVEAGDLLLELQKEHPEVINAHRILNKNKEFTTFVRIDINNIGVIDELLGKKFIYLQNVRVSVTEYLVPAKVLVCSRCFLIGHFRNMCPSKLEICRICGEGVEDLNKHKELCNKKQCCIRCKGSHESNDVRCPEIKSYRSILTKSLLNKAGNMNQHQHQFYQQHQHQQNQHHLFHHHQHRKQHEPVNYQYNDKDSPVLNADDNINGRGGTYGAYNAFNSTSKRIDELFAKMNKLDQNLNRLIELNNNYLDQITSVQQVVEKHENEFQVQQADISFQHGFISQFISPICQVMLDVIPSLVKHHIVADNTLLCPSLTELCEKLSGELSLWTSRFAETESIKTKLRQDYNMKNQHIHHIHSNNNKSNTDAPLLIPDQ